MLGISFFVVCFGLVLAEKPIYEECGLKAGPTLPEGFPVFPDLFEETLASYVLNTHILLPLEKKTVFIKEYQFYTDQKGLLEITEDRKTYFFLYLVNGENKEFFLYKDGNCTLEASTVPSLPQEYGFPAEEEKDYYLFGPSSLFRIAFVQSQQPHLKTAIVYLGKDAVRKGAYTWAHCDHISKYVTYYNFEEPTTNSILVIKNMTFIPNSIQVHNSKDGNKLLREYFFYGLDLFIPPQIFEFILEVPKGFGCDRNSSDLQLPPPALSQRSFFFEAEVKFIPAGSVTHSIMMTRALFDAQSGALAYVYTGWKQGDDGTVKVGEQERIVWDVVNEIEYKISSGRRCEAQRVFGLDDEPYAPAFPFFDGESFNLINDNLLLTTDGFVDMGRKAVRGIPTRAFEKKVPWMSLGKKGYKNAIITRYYLDKMVSSATNFADKDMPIRIQASFEDVDGGISFLVMDTFDYTSYVADKRKEMFDLSQCIQHDDDAIWFQVAFQANTTDFANNLKHEQDIVDKFRDVMYWSYSQLGYTRMRMPQVLIDWDANFFYISALLLERPDFRVDFQPPQMYGLTKPAYEIKTYVLQDCAAECLRRRPTCTAFAFCGTVCQLHEGSIDDTADLVEGPNCNLYRSKDATESVMRPSNDILIGLAENVDTRNFKLDVYKIVNNNEPVMVTYTAHHVNPEIAKGVWGIYHRAQSEDIRFKRYLYRFQLTPADADLGKTMGQMTFAECEEACVGFGECQTISYCFRSKECLISSKHATDLTNEDYSPNTQCVIMTRNYADIYFKVDHLQLLGALRKKPLKTDSVDGCAAACETETGFKCNSFDYCDTPVNDDKENTCWLSEVDIEDENKEVVVLSPDLPCAHYAKRRMLNFRKTQQLRVQSPIGQRVDMTDEECAKQCYLSSSCNSFDFCQSRELTNKACYLNQVPDEKAQLVDSVICDHYQKIGFLTTTGNEGKEDNKTEGTSVGMAVGLGILMLVIGLLLGFGGVYGICYLKVNYRR